MQNSFLVTCHRSFQIDHEYNGETQYRIWNNKLEHEIGIFDEEGQLRLLQHNLYHLYPIFTQTGIFYSKDVKK